MAASTMAARRSLLFIRVAMVRLLRALQWRNRIEEAPQENGHRIDRRGDVERHIPVILGSAEHVSDDGGRGRAAQVTHHIHGARQGARVLATDIHAGAPRAGHHQIVAEAGQSHRNHRRHGIVHARRATSRRLAPLNPTYASSRRVLSTLPVRRVRGAAMNPLTSEPSPPRNNGSMPNMALAPKFSPRASFK